MARCTTALPGYIHPTRPRGFSTTRSERPHHIAFAGSSVNVELARIDDEAVVEAALPAQAYKDLGLKPDDRVFIRLRNTRFFDEDYSI
jgi:hypothetical protein